MPTFLFIRLENTIRFDQKIYHVYYLYSAHNLVLVNKLNPCVAECWLWLTIFLEGINSTEKLVCSFDSLHICCVIHCLGNKCIYRSYKWDRIYHLLLFSAHDELRINNPFIFLLTSRKIENLGQIKFLYRIIGFWKMCIYIQSLILIPAFDYDNRTVFVTNEI